MSFIHFGDKDRTAQVIQLGVKPPVQPGMSDAQLTLEYAAQKRLLAALDELCAAIGWVNSNSVCVSIRTAAVEDFIHDEMPDSQIWDEKVAAARANG